MSNLLAPRRVPKQARSGYRLFAMEEVAMQLLIQGGPAAVTPRAMIETYRRAGGKVSKQWVSDYMGNGEAVLRRLAIGHFKVMANYAEEAGQLAARSRDLDHAAGILAHHVMGAQDPWFGRAHPALCGLLFTEGVMVQKQWFDALLTAATRVLIHFQLPHAAYAAAPATHAMLGAWLGLVLEGRDQDEHRLDYLSGAFLGAVRAW